ncbi:MAG: tetratricopeptide repeat protein [Calothrix sp. C42_A2020_038]|nr:tetratricopeptide repeat protein [Calothrix sp. C42_A2020_038]
MTIEPLQNLNRLNAQVVQTVGQGDIITALKLAQEAVTFAENFELTEHAAFCDSLNNLAELYRRLGRFADTEPIYIKALNTRKSILGEKHIDVAESINNLAAFYLSRGDYSKATDNFFVALEMWESLLGAEHPQVAIALNNIAEVYREQGLYFDAEKIYSRVLEIQNNSLDAGHPDIWRTLNNIAALYEAQGRYSEAESKHLEALAFIKNFFGSEHPDVAVTLNNLAYLYDSQGRYLEAEINYLQVLDIWKKYLPTEHTYIADILNNIAENCKEQGRYLEAEQKHLEALRIRKNIFGDIHPLIATSLSNLGEIHLLQGRYLLAEKNYLEALEMRQSLFTAEHPDIAQSLNNLAVLYSYQGRYSQAEHMHIRALSMWERLLGNSHPDYAHSLSNLAAIYQDQGRYSEAEQTYLQVLTIRKNALGEQHPHIADCISDIAEIYRLQGRYRESKQLYLEALAMRKRLLGDMHPRIAESLNNLAVLYNTQFQYSQAESLLIEALIIIKTVFGEQHPQVANSISNLATIYSSQGRYPEAEELHLKVLRMRKSLLGEQHPNIANSLSNLGEIYFSQGRHQEAEQYYTQALSMRKSLLGQEHPETAQSLNNIATVLAATGRYSESLSHRVQASTINDKIIGRAFAFSSENDRLAFIDKIRVEFDLFLSLIQTHFCHSTSAQQTALDFILKRKALTSASLAAQNKALYSQKYPHLQENFSRLNDLNAQIVKLTFSPPDTDFSIYQKKLSELEAQYNNLQKQLAAQIPEIQLSKYTDRFSVAEALPNNSILLEFVRFDLFDFHGILSQGDKLWRQSRYLVFILPAKQPNAVTMIDLGESEKIDDLIQQFRLQASIIKGEKLGFAKSAKVPKLKTISYDTTAALQLSQALFHPIYEALSNYKHLIIAPDGNLNLLPFQLIPTNTSEELLIDKYTISYLGVGRDILRSQVQTSHPSSAPLIIADPDFDLASQENITTEIQPREFISTLDGDILTPTPGTRLLGESIAKKLQNAGLYLGAAAVETLLSNINCPNIMLIATHGLFLPDSYQPPTQNRFSKLKLNNPMMRSALAFAGANTWLSGGTLPPNAGKGFVFAQDIASLNLWANELTVLSACDTGRGDIKIGEGVFGLRRAFAVAGTKTLIMSLWKVPDTVTALLMERFFDNLQLDIGRADALQNAQIYIRNITVKELQKSALGQQVLKELFQLREVSANNIDSLNNTTPLQHPFYWGAWICQGDIYLNINNFCT